MSKIELDVDPSNQEDLRCFKRIGQKEPSAFYVLFERYSVAILELAQRLLGSRDRAEDLTQTVWEKVLIYGTQGGEVKNFKSWIMNVTRNAAYDELRKLKRWKTEEYEDESFSNPSSADTTAEEALAAHQDQETLRQLINELPDMQRVAMWAWLTSQKTQSELAREMRISTKAFEALIRRAKKNLEPKLLNKNSG